MLFLANGAVMRTAITGVIQFYDIEKVIKNTLDICHVCLNELILFLIGRLLM